MLSKSLAAFCVVLLSMPVVLWADSPLIFSWTNLDDPLGTTFPGGISGNNVVGYYGGQMGDYGFLDNGPNFTTLNDPSAETTGLNHTQANGVDGSNVVGWYYDLVGAGVHGFLYDGSNWTTLDYPQANTITNANGISGNKIVGNYRDVNEDFLHGFEYDKVTHSYSKLINPSFPTLGLSATAISGNKIVGFYNTVSPPSTGTSFLFDGTTWTGLSDPQATNGETIAEGIDGNNIVGFFQNATGYHGFLYDGTSWTTLDEPLAQQNGSFGTIVTGISGSSIVGWYDDASNTVHGFKATIVPEPGAWLLALIGCSCLLAVRKRSIS
jgi:hypothetical protein